MVFVHLMSATDVRYLMKIANRPPIVMTEGSGSRLRDSAGREYLDFIQGWAVNCLGHCPPVVADAIAAQARRLINPSPGFFNDRAAELAELLSASSFGGRVFFANSGAEANEGAIKLARKWGARQRGGAYEIITTEHAFHGRTLATMSASGKPQWRDLFEPKVPGFVKVPLNDIAAVEAAVSERTVAVMLEPIQGEAGVFPARPDYLRQLRALASAKGLLLIFDEVQTGVGRTGTLFRYQAVGVEPDIMTLGKGLGGGLPISALLAREEICCFEPGDQGGTLNGNPLVAAAALAVLAEVMRPGFLEHVVTVGRAFRAALERLAEAHGQGAVRGDGLLLALELCGLSGAEIVRRALDRGLLVNSPREDALRFMPALNVAAADVDRCVAILDQVMREMKG